MSLLTSSIKNWANFTTKLATELVLRTSATQLFTTKTVLAFAALGIAVPLGAQAAVTVFDDFNINEGHFNQDLDYSGSTVGINVKTSTAERVTTAPKEGAGCEQLAIVSNGDPLCRVRFLSGTGNPAGNIAFTTSSAMDGWIGCYLKTTNTGWSVQLYLEGASINGGVPKQITADGEWHLYEWDLDNTASDANGWGDVLGLGGVPTVADGSHTIDSIIFRNEEVTDPISVIFMDFMARNDTGSVGDLLNEPCRATSGVIVSGPISTNSNRVIVSGVTNAATAVTVYQDTGGGMVAIGSKTTGIIDGDNLVTVSNLVKTARVAATQTVSGQESCIPTTGVVVGGGNARLRVVYSIKETTSTGPVGEPGEGSSENMHYLGATNVLSGYAPGSGPVLTPSASWQTVTLKRGLETVGDSANARGTLVPSKGYSGNAFVSIQVYAYRTLHGVRIYSMSPAESSLVTSNHAFAVNWTWNAVAGAQGYRLLRNVNGAGYNESVDVASNSFADADAGWAADITVTPPTTQTDSSIQWYPDANVKPDALPGDWGILESIGFAIDDLTDTGPYDLYIDNLQNGTTVFQTFEGAVAGTTDYVFHGPGFSGTTDGGLLMPPNLGEVSNGAADTGTKSFHVQFQWKGTNAASWLRLTTYFPADSPMPGGNPMVNLNDPISIRFLLLPAGATPVPPPRPIISVNRFGGDVVLNWTDAHNLQTSVNVGGTYTNVPGVILAPFTNNFAETQRFFRLAN